ncbi:nucleotide sugar dehydrogenase [Litchfieldia alkalitelluris]|uniref:nucleotide sugar dehydrogenase n=1 Tax=Litchfieldia alkalitelluris TaxID=304268 RepID=UPI00099609C1|nr:nucleotide sugar dehydrogenase [Litchfieldia alkalitelluris]
MEEWEINRNNTVSSIGVVGLGYVGLPLALTLIKKGLEVKGIDNDKRKIDNLKKGKSYLTDVGDKTIQEAIATNRFTASTDFSLLSSVKAIIICVPTPLDNLHNPDLTYLQSAGFEISKYLQRDQLIILESSTYPGTTKEVLVPILEKGGLKVGNDFFVGYSPERIDPGNHQLGMHEIPKIISGVTDNCLERVYNLYQLIFTKLVKVTSTEIAELTKLVENAHRLINISFINELAIICDSLNVNIWEVIRAASTKPFGFTAYYPGPGIGGHCIPVDPLYLQWKARQFGIESEFINMALSVNRHSSKYVVERVSEILHQQFKNLEKANVLIYGVTYKRDVNDVRESPVFQIIHLLQQKGIRVSYHDPYIPEIMVDGVPMYSRELTEQNLQEADCVLIFSDHSIIPVQKILDYAPLIFDTRNVTEGMKGKAKVFRLGGGIV